MPTLERAAASMPRRRGVLASLGQPKVLAMLGLGFASGLPFYLVGNTLGFWLREYGIALSAIGYLSWVGLAYSLKFLWAPLLDRTHAPGFGFLGQRRSWMLVSQLLVMAALAGMAWWQPSGGLTVFALLALVVAFASATQDIVIDAWRIESAADEDAPEEKSALSISGTASPTNGSAALAEAKGEIAESEGEAPIDAAAATGTRSTQGAALPTTAAATVAAPVTSTAADTLGLLTATAQLGYRGALLITDALILILAAWTGWPISYGVMAALMGLGIAATLLAKEPGASAAVAAARARLGSGAASLRGAFDAVAGPFVEFFRAHGRWALPMLVAVSLYRLPDFLMGPMANPFYADLGLAKETVGALRSSAGLAATFVGIALGGLSALRLGFVPTLLLGAVLGPASNLAFTAMALAGPDLRVFAAALVVDNIATGFAGVALVGYMSSLTTRGYTITQYALLSSFYALPGKVLKGFSGAAVESLQAALGERPGYAAFFAATAVLGLPALGLVAVLVRRQRAVLAAGTNAKSL